MAFAWKILTLLAVLLMPFGMTAAPAAAHNMSAGGPIEHCPDQVPGHVTKGGVAECTMACAAALSATELTVADVLFDRIAPVLAEPCRGLNGLHPETATPPPRIS